MAEALVKQFGVAVPKQISAMLTSAGEFDASAFVAAALKGYNSLNLMQRAVHIADTLHAHLPRDYAQAIQLLLSSIGPPLNSTEGASMAPFLYLPHTLYVARYGLEHFELSMQAQHALTQRFSAEFSIRPYIERYPAKTFAMLKQWAHDDSVHVRRLVSEGTRPRLPWASRLRGLQKDPSPILKLLELLKDDPELYVRRSVANNLNDIGKDHPELLADTARRWLEDADPNRQWIIKHALRSAVKRAEPGALAVLGFGARATVVVTKARIAPARVRIGEQIRLSFSLSNPTRRTQQLLLDFRIHFIKANGLSKPKVFKLKQLTLAAGASVKLHKTVSLQEMTTRKHYPGVHRLDLLINGNAQSLATFELKSPR
jgi:3-methyladenine DNA glycosylase AlkC